MRFTTKTIFRCASPLQVISASISFQVVALFFMIIVDFLVGVQMLTAHALAHAPRQPPCGRPRVRAPYARWLPGPVVCRRSRDRPAVMGRRPGCGHVTGAAPSPWLQLPSVCGSVGRLSCVVYHSLFTWCKRNYNAPNKGLSSSCTGTVSGLRSGV